MSAIGNSMRSMLEAPARKCLRLLGLRRGAVQRRPPPSGDPYRPVSFLCNVCGTPNCLPQHSLTREGGQCAYCGCYGRLRSVAYAVTARYSADDFILARMSPRKDVRGLGCSDWGYADLLAEKFDYVDTFYEHEPRLDLNDVDWTRWTPESFDFITCTDVLEHVEPPIERTFENVARLLKPGGAAVITVPATLDPHTREHFPHLHEWKIVSEDGKDALVNLRRDGAIERFADLCFHGGRGTTLEFRYFSRRGLIEAVERAGLRAAEIIDRPIGPYAIPLAEDNFVLVAEKPGGSAAASRLPRVDPYRLLSECQDEIAARRAAAGPDPCRYAERYRLEELGYWLHVPGWIERDFGRRAERGEYLTCLDVGCAYGTLLLFAAKLLHCVPFAVDFIDYLDPSSIEAYGIHYRRNNIEREPFPWQTQFDAILFTEILEHLNFNALPTLRKLRALLKPGGRLYLTTPDAAQWGRQTKYYASYADLPMPSEAGRFSVIDDHVWQFDAEELEHLIDAAGFRVVRRDYAPGSGKRHFNFTLAGT